MRDVYSATLEEQMEENTKGDQLINVLCPQIVATLNYLEDKLMWHYPSFQNKLRLRLTNL